MSVVARVVERARVQPDAVAVTDGQQTYSYAELARAVLATAGHLADVAPGERVAVLGPRCARTVVALLAVEAAGAVAVPISESWPPARTHQVLTDAGAHAAVLTGPLTDAVIRSRMRTLADVTDTGPAGVQPPSGDSACVVHTAGPSREPAAVLVSRSSLDDELRGRVAALGLTDTDRIAATADVSTRAGLGQLLTGLVAGATTVVLDEPAFRHDITVLEINPRHLAALLRSTVDTGALRWLVTTGGPVPPELADAWRLTAPDVPMVITYGTAETGTLIHWLPGRTVVRGQPIVLDTGELVAGGQRTGDLFVRTENGDLEFRGRVDRRVRIRDTTVDLDQLEAALRAQPGVTDCAVTVRSRQRRLVARAVLDSAAEDAVVIAYVTGAPPARPPALVDDVIAVAELPLTQNGTIAYRRLAETAASAGGQRAYVPPETEDQARVCDVWAEVLGVDRVGIHDSFLATGGDSLQALRIIARLRGVTGKPLTVRDVLLNETPERLAAVLAGRQSTEDSSAAGATAPAPHGYPLSAHQAGVYFQWLMAPDSPYYSYQGTLYLHGPLDEPRLRRAWRLLLEENPSLLVRFAEAGGEPVQHIPYWTVELGPTVTGAGADRFTADAHAEARRPFDLKGEPLLRTTLYRFGPDEHRLLVTMHEILLDGWGALVLFGRLGELYARPELGPDTRRRELFTRYLSWQERHHASAEVQAAGQHWEAGLAGAPPVLDLPTDRPRPAFPSFRGGLIEQVLPPGSARTLARRCAERGITPFMVMLGAFALTLTYHAGEQEVVVGAPMANRDTDSQVDVVGFLLNMLPLRVSTEPDRVVGEYLDRIRGTVLDGLAASDYPFAWILRKLDNLPRTLDRAPAIQVMLNMLNYPVKASSHDGVDFRFVEMDTGFTKFDCALYVQPHGSADLLLQFAYQTDLFDERTARRLLDGVLLAVDALTGDEARPIGEIDLLPAAERQLLDSFAKGDTR